jgi:hypothetical protein
VHGPWVLTAVAALAIGASGCSLSQTIVEWQVDSAIADFVDEVDPPANDRVVLELLADDAKGTVFELLYDASDAATAVQDELEKPDPKMQAVRRHVHGLLDEVEALPVPLYLERLAAWYARLDPESRARFRAAVKPKETDTAKDERTRKDADEQRKKRRSELMDRLELDDAQRRRVLELLALDEAERKASDADWKLRRKPLDEELAKPDPDPQVVLGHVLDAWSKADFGRWKKTLDRWLGFYETLRPAQKKTVNEHFADQLDELPRFER